MTVLVKRIVPKRRFADQGGLCNTEHALVSVKVDALQFRPNLVLSGSLPNDEDNWQTVSICNQQFTVLGGGNWWSSGEHRPSHRFLSQSESTHWQLWLLITGLGKDNIWYLIDTRQLR